jgi:hypothetical protein
MVSLDKRKAMRLRAGVFIKNMLQFSLKMNNFMTMPFSNYTGELKGL